MFTKEDIPTLINECRAIAKEGLGNGQNAVIEDLNVDFLSPQNEFLGVGNNPAIFVNQKTYAFLGKYHENWAANKTIAVRESLLESKDIQIIGVLVHETGHAFNVAAKIINSEANAYIFEIEVLMRWYKTKNPLLRNCSKIELLHYFESRLPYYSKETRANPYLADLVAKIIANQLLGDSDLPVEKLVVFKKRKVYSCVLQNHCSKPTTFFRSKSLHIDTFANNDEETSSYTQ